MPPKTSPARCPFGQRRLRILRLLVEQGMLPATEISDRDRTIPRGTLYTTLRRLEAAGFVVSRRHILVRTAGPPRRLYRITKRGRQYCRLSTELIQLFGRAT